MDKFSSSFDSLSEIFWNESLPVNQSDFVPYQNMNKRKIEFARKLPGKGEIERGGGGGGGEPPDRCYRHMMNERMRREKEKEGYLVLHSMLPRGTKNDKNSIVQMAAATIEELQRYSEELRRRNLEVESMLKAEKKEEESEDDGVSKKIRIIRRAENPASGVDSMLAELKQLKTSQIKTRAIRSNFSFPAQQFSAEFVIQTTQVEDGELEKVMQGTRQEAQGEFQSHFGEVWTT